MYDVSRFYTLKSLENWLEVAFENKWINENSFLALVANKIDLQKPEDTFTNQMKDGITKMLINQGIQMTKGKMVSFNISCVSQEGMDALHSSIVIILQHYDLFFTLS